MPKSLLLVLLALIPYLLQGQNLVPNPEFDSYTTCPNTRGQIAFAAPWFSPNGKTVDFAHLCAGLGQAGVPLNRWGDQYPVLGNGYAGIRTYFQSDDGTWENYREYLSVELTQTLDTGQWYYVSFQVSAGESAEFYSDDLGLALTDTVGSMDVLPYTPAVANRQGQFLNNYTNWRTIKGTYQAKGGERFATIGNFLDDPNTTIKTGGVWDSLFSSTYYFIDEVIVSPCDFQADKSYITAAKDTFCQGESVELSLNSQLVLTGFEWFDMSSNPTISVQDSGWYWVELTDSKGCQLKDSIYLHKELPPEFGLGPDTLMCPDEAWILSVPPQANLRYEWENGAKENFRYIDQAGTYALTVISPYCSRTDQIVVGYPEKPAEDFGFDTLVCEGAPLVLTYDFAEADYIWQDGSAERSFSVDEAGTYSLILLSQCYEVSDDFEVMMQNCDCTERIPNVFTPNGDGINDQWWIDFSPGVEAVKWGIVDRWGRPLFETQNVAARWEGQFRGKALPEGVYYYWVHYRCWDGEGFIDTQSSGSLSLFR
ncbi:MAG: gliding motility-associated C-terminal domain-containing protein [Bacteroidota bacterium]